MFLRPNNLVTFIAICVIFANIKTWVREKFRIQGIDDKSFMQFIRNEVHCFGTICIEDGHGNE